MWFKQAQGWAVLCLVLSSSPAAGLNLRALLLRDDPSPTVNVTSAAASTTDGSRAQSATSLTATVTTHDKSVDVSTAATTAASSGGSQVTSTANSTDASAASTVAPSSTTSTVATATPTAINGNVPSNSSIFNITAIPDGELPLAPVINPGWGVAGAILMISGAVYTLIGIKNPALHTFFSTAYLASLSTSVLIVYVMAPPVPDAIHGAYVVAVVITGIILGGAATVFKELTECLGCLLGGFTFGMWLLTLQDGGLLKSVGPKVGLITAFTLAGFVLYFTKWTRAYSLIVLISFAGATVTVLGIDCFSRAGLKEFWVYIWQLNDNIFPLGTETYPMTKGIRVEIALIIIISLLGIVSQLKLWKVVQQHREKKAAEKADEDRKLEAQEADIGRQLEASNARERRHWEATYGDGHPPGTPTSSGDSGVADLETEKKLSQATVAKVSDTEEEIEMAEMTSREATPQPPAKKDGLVIGGQDESGRVTVRVARDDETRSPVQDGERSPAMEEEKVWVVGADGEARPVSQISARNSHRFSRSGAPDVTPLPFRIPGVGNHYEGDDDRSSVAANAEDDNASIRISKRASRNSTGNRLSLLRSLSQRSQKSQQSKRQSADLEKQQLSPTWGQSREGLVEEPHHIDDDTGSLAATIDDMSVSDERSISGDVRRRSDFTMEITAELGAKGPEGKEVPRQGALKAEDASKSLKPRPTSNAETIATDILNSSVIDESTGNKSKRSSTTFNAAKTDATTDNGEPTDTTITADHPEDAKPTQSVAASVDSTPASLTKERLPSGLSRVALSYRTNEWAKHLSQAELPSPEKLQLNEYPAQEAPEHAKESSAPVDVESLQLTAANGTPAPAVGRSPSVMSNYSQVPPNLARSESRASTIKGPVLAAANPDSQIGESTATLQANPIHSSHSFRAKPIVRRSTSSDVLGKPIIEENAEEEPMAHSPLPMSPEEEEEPAVQQHNPFQSPQTEAQAEFAPIPGIVSYNAPQTLLGQRDVLLRSRSQASFYNVPGARNSSESTSLHNYAMYSQYAAVQDVDDLPLSQRKELMRQASVGSGQSVVGAPAGSIPSGAVAYVASPTPGLPATVIPFDSHQPQRQSSLPTPQMREAQLANFRESVAADLRGGPTIMPSSSPVQENSRFSTSVNSLVRAGGGVGRLNQDGEVRRSINMGRNMLLSQKEQEIQRREMERLDKERNERVFEERMRHHDMQELHREAMRKMQNNAKGQKEGH